MKTLPKIFLAVSAIGFLAGSIIDFGGINCSPSWTVAMPLGAVFLGLFMIWFMLGEEMAQFDEEEAGRLQLAGHRHVAGQQKPAGQSSAAQFKEKTLLHGH
jgi:hypothetical protein